MSFEFFSPLLPKLHFGRLLSKEVKLHGYIPSQVQRLCENTEKFDFVILNVAQRSEESCIDAAWEFFRILRFAQNDTNILFSNSILSGNDVTKIGIVQSTRLSYSVPK